MNSGLHEVPKRGIDHPLALHTALAGKLRAFDSQAEMAFARRIISAVSSVLFTVVRQLDVCRQKRRIEPRKHLSRDRTGSLDVH